MFVSTLMLNYFFFIKKNTLYNFLILVYLLLHLDIFSSIKFLFLFSIKRIFYIFFIEIV